MQRLLIRTVLRRRSRSSRILVAGVARGAAVLQMFTQVMSGQVDMIFESPLLVAKNTGKLRPLGVVSAKRNPKLPARLISWFAYKVCPSMKPPGCWAPRPTRSNNAYIA